MLYVVPTVGTLSSRNGGKLFFIAFAYLKKIYFYLKCTLQSTASSCLRYVYAYRSVLLSIQNALLKIHLYVKGMSPEMNLHLLNFVHLIIKCFAACMKLLSITQKSFLKNYSTSFLFDSGRFSTVFNSLFVGDLIFNTSNI
jgi:hypothetical protein